MKARFGQFGRTGKRASCAPTRRASWRMAYEADELEDEELDGQSCMSWPGATLDAAVPGILAWPGGWLLDLPGARSLAFVGHSIELDALLALDVVSAVARVGPMRATPMPTAITAAAAPGSVICISWAFGCRARGRTTC